MDTLQAYFTTRSFNPVSLAIRMANPESLFKMSQASHVIIPDGDTGYCMEANMLHGVRRVLLSEALKGLSVVKVINYEVPNAEAGMQWMRDTCAAGAKYDWPGALGLGLAPERNWQDPSAWFCFEFFANGMAKSGRKAFENDARVTANLLMSLNPKMCGVSG